MAAMLDIRLVREQPDFVKSRLTTRGGEDAARVDELLEIDALQRREETEVQALRAEKKKLSKEIGALRLQQKPSEDLEDRVDALNDKIAIAELMLSSEAEDSLTSKRRNLL